MNQGKYVFSQIAEFIPQRYFERIMVKHKDRTEQWSLTSWSQMLVLMFGQLDGCNSLRELTDITTAHAKNPFTLVLVGHLLTGRNCPELIKSVITKFLKNLPIIW